MVTIHSRFEALWTIFAGIRAPPIHIRNLIITGGRVMDRPSCALATPDISTRSRITTTASSPRRRHADDEVQRACTAAQAVVAVTFGQSGFQPASSGASPIPARRTAFARQIAMYLAHIGFGISMAEVGKVFG